MQLYAAVQALIALELLQLITQLLNCVDESCILVVLTAVALDKQCGCWLTSNFLESLDARSKNTLFSLLYTLQFSQTSLKSAAHSAAELRQQ
jgi:hypothetical protein